MRKILFINGPNLNLLGKREPAHYGKKTLKEIEDMVKAEGIELGIEVITFQSNHEGEVVDFIQDNYIIADGIIINPGAFTHYSYAIYDVLKFTSLPIVEVHLSNIFAREDFRTHSVISPIAKGVISGLGYKGYLYALNYLSELLNL